jgi:hypothetical protein
MTALVAALCAACSSTPSNEGPEPDPESGDPQPVAEVPRLACRTSGLEGRILIDASRDGGVWWYPQAGTFDPTAPHQGQQLADHLRERGYVVDELARGRVVTDTMLSSYEGAIRAGQYGTYSTGELLAYDRFLDCGRTLVLLGEFLQDGGVDELAESIGIPLQGKITGAIVDFAEHSITQGVAVLGFNMGSMILAPVPAGITALGWLDSGQAVMGVVAHPKARIFFLGDTNELEQVPQPLVDNLLRWGFE